MSTTTSPTKKTTAPLLSPLVTAQERKKRILERRHQQQQQQLLVRSGSKLESSSHGNSSSLSLSSSPTATTTTRNKRRRSSSPVDLYDDAFNDNCSNALLPPPQSSYISNSMTTTTTTNSLFADLKEAFPSASGGVDDDDDMARRVVQQKQQQQRRTSLRRRTSWSCSSRSLVFAAEETNTTRIDSSAAAASPPSSMSLNHNNDDDLTLKATTSRHRASLELSSGGSLFGAVMQRTAATTTTTTPRLDSFKKEQNGNDIIVSSSRKPEDDSNEITTTTTTPVKQQHYQKEDRHVMWKNNVSTPNHHGGFDHNHNHKSSLTVANSNSPGGFALLKVLDNVTKSPFHHHKKKNVESSSPVKKAASSPEPKNRLDDWHEAHLDITNGKSVVGVVDWSIKRRLRIECHPNICLPGSLQSSSSSSFGGTVVAMQHFMMGTKNEDNAGKNTIRTTTSQQQEDMCRIQWEMGLLYWQHPAVYPLPPPQQHLLNHDGSSSGVVVVAAATRRVVVGDDTTTTTTSNNNNKDNHTILESKNRPKQIMDGASSSVVAKRNKLVSKQLTNTVRGPNAPLQRFVRSKASTGTLSSRLLGGSSSPISANTTTTTTLMLEQRQREWQEAFRSLYLAWYQHVNQLQNNEMLSQSKKVAQTYFYCMAPVGGQVVLFRAGIVNETSSDDQISIVPMIVISSTTQQARDKLKSMGVKLMFLKEGSEEQQDNGGATDQQEQLLVDKKDCQKDDEEAHDDEVRAELEALRRAQAMGVTAGADVSVSMKFRKGTTPGKNENDNFTPMYLVGQDDCDAFFELYLNSLGRLVGGSCFSWNKTDKEVDVKDDPSLLPQQDVPLLLSRKMGPFLHSSLKSLVVTRRREEYHYDMSDRMISKGNRVEPESHQQHHHHHAAIELRGPILPCAVQDLLCASASRMVIDAKQQQHKREQFSASCVDERGEHGFGRAGGEAVGESDSKLKGDSNNTADGAADDVVGTHYFVMHVQSHESEVSPSSDGGALRDPGSAWLNGQGNNNVWNQISADNDSFDEESSFHECGHGEVMSMAVWDVARPNVIAYKIDAAPSIAP